MQSPAPADLNSSPKPSSDKVPTIQKLGYGLGSIHDMWGHWLYSTLAFQVFNIFLGVAPWLVSTALFVNRFFDAFSDALFGWLSDNTRSRWGRRRPYILAGSILGGICLPLLVAVSPGWGSWHVELFGNQLEISHYFWFMILSSAIYIPIMSCFYMPYQSLGYELTPDYHERTSVFSFRNGVQKLPELVMFFAAQFTTMSIWVGADYTNLIPRLKKLFTSSEAWAAAANTDKPNILIGAQVFCCILGVLMIVAGIGVFALVRERYYGNVVARKQEKLSLLETLKLTFACKPFRAQIAMALAYGLGTSMVGALGYYNTVYYVCQGRLGEAAVWNFWMGLSGMVFGFLGLPFYSFIARLIGKRHAMMVVLICAIGAFTATWWLYDPTKPLLQIFACGFIAFTGAGFWMLYGSMSADVVDADEIETGKRREGAFAACASWLMKVGMSVGSLASGFILSSTGFDAKLGGNQTGQALFMIRLLLAVIPILGLVMAFLAVLSFSLTQSKMAEIRTELESRRGAV